MMYLHRVSKNSQNCFWHNLVKFPSASIIFGTKMAKTILLCRCTHLPPYLIYVDALLCETQMLQIVTLHGDYLYYMAHLCLINSAEGATWFNNFEVFTLFYAENSRQQNSWLMSLKRVLSMGECI